MSPLPGISLLNGLNPLSRDLWLSGVGVREIVQATGVWTQVWRPTQRFYFLLVPTGLIATQVMAEVLRIADTPGLHRGGLDWIRFALATLCYLVLFVGLFMRRNEFRLLVSLRVARRSLPPQGKVRKASEFHLFTSPSTRALEPAVSAMLWIYFASLIEFFFLLSFLPAQKPIQIILTTATLIVLMFVTGYLSLRLRRLPRDIDAQIEWLTTEGEARYNAILQEMYGEAKFAQGKS